MSLENFNGHTTRSFEDDSGTAEEKKSSSSSSSLKREQDSSDDFEQVDHESIAAANFAESTTRTTTSTKEDTQLQQQLLQDTTSTRNQVTDHVRPSASPPSPPLLEPRVEDNHRSSQDPTTKSSNNFDSKLDYDTNNKDEHSVPATPPPSADIEKFNNTVDPFQSQTAFQPSFGSSSSNFLAFEKQSISSEKFPSTGIRSSPSAFDSGDTRKDNNDDNSLARSTVFQDSDSIAKERQNRMDEEKEKEEEELIMSSNLVNPDNKSASTLISDISNFTKDQFPSSKDHLSAKKESTGGSEIASAVATAATAMSMTSSTGSGKHAATADATLFKDDKKAATEDDFNAVGKQHRDEKVIVPSPLTHPSQPPPPPPSKKFVDDKSMFNETQQQQQNEVETGESEFESEQEASPVRVPTAPVSKDKKEDNLRHLQSKELRKAQDTIEIAPKKIFANFKLDAWFNPESLNPRVAALIYWRDPYKSGIVFGSILGLLLSLAYFSLISVLAYLSLLVLTGTFAYRIYKSVLQAVQKTSDGHPFKYILDLDLTLPAEKVHEVADVAVAHANAAVSELRRLFLVEDIVDSLKFGSVLWCLTYLGSLFNGMTLIIIGVVAMFTLPKVYETNKAQIDENWALVEGKINDLTTKIKAAIPLVKKPEPTKEE